MNLFDSSFLCLDIGSSAVHAIAHRVRSGKITKSAMHSVESSDTVFAIKSVVDELEKQIGTRFDSAFITGNFGNSEFEMAAKSTIWSGEHKITESDVRYQISQISPKEGFYPIHIIPLRYDSLSMRNLLTPIGHTDIQLVSVFGVICYEKERMTHILSKLRSAHIQAEAFLDQSFLLDDCFRDKKQTALFIDLGAEFTTISVWTGRGPVFFEKIQKGQSYITKSISSELNIRMTDAEKIKIQVASVVVREMDRFTPADTAYDFSRADLNDIILPVLLDIIETTKETIGSVISKYNPSKIFLSGGGSGITGVEELFENTFGITTQNIGSDAVVRSLSNYIWKQQSSHVKAYLARRERWDNRISKIFGIFKKKKTKHTKFIPIMPSTLAFNMKNSQTYELFKAGSISMIHVDIMDGFFVDKIAGGIDELKFINDNTNAHLHVHLMTESPAVWASAAANSGADTIIVSTNTAGVRAALRKIKELGKRSGIALNPESSIDILKPILKEIDEVLIMSVRPGSGGQEFDENILKKIFTLANTRKKYGLKFKISVDGGINPETAKACWQAGADFLVSGSYLSKSHDFPNAVQSLIRQE
ncbi:MAG: ribulose-phosphate 3-epimerase [Alphaproteobacteria bacterium]|nr:ribulose-phosphate 3-epimerase [Alphaproteobacteria bacterium]MBN2674938.1 ribulose-phosphate 3-epimerase [Alphaproteobacteria bacterium]